MNQNFLDFEQPIAELEAKIAELRHASQGSAFNIEEEIGKLRDKLKVRTEEIFRELTPWQVAQLARHPLRPYTLDYIGHICEEFEELAGDRAYADDAALVCGIGRIDGKPVTIIGHQKGRDTKSKIKRNFGDMSALQVRAATQGVGCEPGMVVSAHGHDGPTGPSLLP